MDLPINKIICGDAKTELAKLPAESINCCISSPPYWALRDYGTAIWEGGSPDCSHEVGRFKYPASKKQKSNAGSASHQAKDICPDCGAKRIDKQLGLEKTFEEYIDKLCDIYDEVKRVLRPDGCVFVNLGDTYAGSGIGTNDYRTEASRSINKTSIMHPKGAIAQKVKNIPAKSLCLIPQRFAIEMINRGWILRNVIIWHKPNPMPSSAKDRFTVDFEYVYFFVKNNQVLWHYRPADGKVSDKQPDYKNGDEGLDWQWGIRKGKKVKTSLWQGFKYFFEPQYEPHKNPEFINEKYGTLGEHNTFSSAEGNRSVKFGTKWSPNERAYNPLGRNKHTVWTIPTQACPEAHFATFPNKLVEPMIKAGCPEFVCKKCGKARAKVYKPSPEYAKKLGTWTEDTDKDPELRAGIGFAANTKKHSCTADYHFKGYTDCGCNDREWRPGIVLDPFAGTCTVAKVAAQLRRDYIMIELKQEYIDEIAMPKLNAVESGVPVKEQKQGQGALFNG
jgi:site-specific DNA-methyltransferase (cytosine-N4-specific)